jgi:two-component system sensor histidine kinase UhpB
VHPADRERREAAIRAALTEGKSFIMEFRLRRYDGEYRWMYSSGTPQFEPDGTIAGCMGFSVDVTERRRSGRALRQYARRLRAISRQLVHVQEAERQRLSTELHDLVGQNLSALNITLNMIRGQMAPGAAASLISRLDDSQALLASTVEEIREVIADLRPALLDDYGLVSALRWYGERFEARTGIRVAIVAHASLARLSPAAESGLYRIAQEALTNAAKHSRANCIDIKLENSDRDMRMVITDNGVGFSVADAGRLHKRNGWGLIMMRERAAVIRARLELQSIPGEGTCITVELKAIR